MDVHVRSTSLYVKRCYVLLTVYCCDEFTVYLQHSISKAYRGKGLRQ